MVTRVMSRFFAVSFLTSRPFGGVCLSIFAAVLAIWVRYDFIEPEKLGAACADGAFWWCAPRTGLIVAAELDLLGTVALGAVALGALPSVRLHLFATHLALFVGGAGLVLYNATFSAVAVVLAVVLLAYRRENPR